MQKFWDRGFASVSGTWAERALCTHLSDFGHVSILIRADGLYSHCLLGKSPPPDIREPAACERSFFNLIIGTFADQITVRESATVSCEFTKDGKGMTGEFILKPTTPQSLAFDGSTNM